MLAVCIPRQQQMADPEPISISEKYHDTFKVVEIHKLTSISIILMADTRILDLDYFHHD